MTETLDYKEFPAKILLFGEYGILLGSDALSIPFFGFSGHLEKGNCQNSKVWNNFLNYIIEINNQLYQTIDIAKLEEDIKSGLWFDSSIPLNYGLGSSGALVAAIFDAYRTVKNETHNINLLHLKSDLALIESFYHGQSSGIDPLVSLLGNTVLVKNGNYVEKLPQFPVIQANKIKVNLIDSGKSSDTSSLVKNFINRLANPNFNTRVTEAYFSYSNKAVQFLLDNNQEGFYQSIRSLSTFQFEHLSDFIPENILHLFEEGLKSGDFAMKLCGSGGGGMFLCFSAQGLSVNSDIFKDFKTYSVLS